MLRKVSDFLGKKILDIIKCIALPLFVYCLFFVLSKGRYGNIGSMLAIARQTVLYTLVGWALMHNQIMGVWDFTPGAVVALSGIIAGRLMYATNTGVLGLVIFSVITATVLTLITFSVFHFMRIPSMICGLGILLIYEMLTSQLFGGAGVTVRGDLTILAKAPYCYIILIVSGIVIYILFNYTQNGANTRTLGYGQKIAMNIGVDLTKTRIKNFIIEGVFLGLAAVISLSQKGNASATVDMASMSLGFDAIMGVFIGINLMSNCNLVIGIVIGTFTMKMLSAGLIAIGLNSNLQSIAQGIFLMIFIGLSSNKDRFLAYMNDRKHKGEILRRINAE
ncbi:hypothetical protein IMSAGC007_03535 [Lachnospiraceae bacterium]|nr:hypothetical protein IMSAGC007_03535 [Lachnospiraceae bacterium]